MGILARSVPRAGKDSHPTRKFWVFFYLVKSNGHWWEFSTKLNEAKFAFGESCLVAKSCATISARDETSSLRNIRFKACFTEFSVIQSSFPISAFVRPKATNLAICNSRDVRRSVLKGWCCERTVAETG
jgi:hypothetical protein